MIRVTDKYKLKLQELEQFKSWFDCENCLNLPPSSGLKTWFATSQSGLKTHNHQIVPIQAIKPSPTCIHAVKQISK